MSQPHPLIDGETGNLMCGLAGKVSTRPAGESSQHVERSLDVLEHRGPDDRGCEVLVSGRWSVALGHTRLSIIDLSDAGHQPMLSQDGRFAIVFNGEIYNFKEIRQDLRSLGVAFSSETDTEVLLAAWLTWGLDVLPRLIGMFVFAVTDVVGQTVTLVRDGFGVKPIFWSLSGNEFSFASETKAMEKVIGRRLSPNNSVVARFLMLGHYDTGVETFFEGVYRLESGTALTLNLSQDQLQPEVHTWWNPCVSLIGPSDFEEAAELIREKFLESVTLHLRSDVSLGFALSGGIDSSAIVHAARYLEPDLPIRTFSFVSPGAPDNEESWIDLVNESVGAESFKVSADPKMLEADLFDLIRTQGEPFGGTSIYAQYIVYRLARESGVTVTLDGQGADEIFAGYFGYVEHRLQTLMEEGKFFDAVKLFQKWSTWPGRSKSSALKRLLSLYIPDRSLADIRSILGSQNGGINLSWLKGDVKGFYRTGFHSQSGEHGRQLASILRWELTHGGLGPRLKIHIAVILGSGWGKTVDHLGTSLSCLQASEVPGFVPSSVPGHAGLIGVNRTAGGKNVLFISSRSHLYQGRGVGEVVHSIRTAAAAGAKTIILTNGAGGIKDPWSPGQPVLISDHINLTGTSPLRGATFIDLTDLYSKRLRDLARTVDPSLDEGVYVQFRGPHYETPAEVQMAKVMGGHIVGMSTALEAIAAREAGMEVLGLSLITNLASGISPHPLSHAEVLDTGASAEPVISSLLTNIVQFL